MKHQKLNGHMSVRTAERVLTNMLGAEGIEVMIVHKKDKRDVRDDAKVSSIRKFKKV